MQSSGKPHKLTHFQYTSWPDHGVPMHPASLVKLAKEVRKVHGNKQAPMVVHCRWEIVACITGWYSLWLITMLTEAIKNDQAFNSILSTPNPALLYIIFVMDSFHSHIQHAASYLSAYISKFILLKYVCFLQCWCGSYWHFHHTWCNDGETEGERWPQHLWVCQWNEDQEDVYGADIGEQ